MLHLEPSLKQQGTQIRVFCEEISGWEIFASFEMPTQVLDLAMEGILLGASSNSIALKKKRGRGGEPKTNNSGPRSQYFVKRYHGGRSLLSLRC